MDKGDKIEFNDNRMDGLRKDGTFSIIYLKLKDDIFRVHTVIIDGDKEIHNYQNIKIEEVYLL